MIAIILFLTICELFLHYAAAWLSRLSVWEMTLTRSSTLAASLNRSDPLHFCMKRSGCQRTCCLLRYDLYSMLPMSIPTNRKSITEFSLNSASRLDGHGMSLKPIGLSDDAGWTLLSDCFPVVANKQWHSASYSVRWPTSFSFRFWLCFNALCRWESAIFSLNAFFFSSEISGLPCSLCLLLFFGGSWTVDRLFLLEYSDAIRSDQSFHVSASM